MQITKPRVNVAYLDLPSPPARSSWKNCIINHRCGWDVNGAKYPIHPYSVPGWYNSIGKKGYGYSFIICWGEVWALYSWESVLWHAYRWNGNSISIAYLGNPSEKKIDRKDFNAWVWLNAAICKHFGWLPWGQIMNKNMPGYRVSGHTEIGATDDLTKVCPGYPMIKIRNQAARALQDGVDLSLPILDQRY